MKNLWKNFPSFKWTLSMHLHPLRARVCWQTRSCSSVTETKRCGGRAVNVRLHDLIYSTRDGVQTSRSLLCTAAAAAATIIWRKEPHRLQGGSPSHS